MNQHIIPIDAGDLALAALLLLALGVLSLMQRLALERPLAIAAIRSLLQLLAVGYILQWLFDRGSPLYFVLAALVMLLAAGREVNARQKRRFRGSFGFFASTISMLLSSVLLAIFALVVIIEPQPWFSLQYSIPLLGMLLGNTLNGISLGFDRLLQGAWTQRQLIEQRLMLGETAASAISSIRTEAFRAAMIPTINAMAAAGLVSLPGMMTGQILGGTPPMEAVKYQILIFWLITAGTGTGVFCAIHLSCRRLFDTRERLRLDRLR